MCVSNRYAQCSSQLERSRRACGVCELKLAAHVLRPLHCHRRRWAHHRLLHVNSVAAIKHSETFPRVANVDTVVVVVVVAVVSARNAVLVVVRRTSVVDVSVTSVCIRWVNFGDTLGFSVAEAAAPVPIGGRLDSVV
jgi:hypothetical protein